MADIDMGNLYDINKSVIKEQGKLSKKKIKEAMTDVVYPFIVERDNTYYMMLCKEVSDYTIFKINYDNDSMDNLAAELTDCINNRGNVYDISMDSNGAIAIWIEGKKDGFVLEEGSMHCYYLFPYDMCVIEV